MKDCATRVTRTLAVAVALLAGAATAHAQLPLTIDDARVREQSGGFWGLLVTVRLPGPPPTANVTVNWTLVPGSATAVPGNDYVMASGTLTFVQLVNDTQTINVQINGDLNDEWIPTLKRDEVFFIELSSPSANAYIAKGRSTITLIDDDRPTPGVQFLAATSGGGSAASSGENKLQWRIPGAQVQPTDVIIRWNTGAGCGFPTNSTGGAGGTNTGGVAGAGAVQTWTHSSLTLDQLHCYSVFAMYGATPTTEIAQVKAKPFDATGLTGGSIVWSYSTGAVSVVPPTVGADAIYTVDNAGIVHAMQRGPSGGAWPACPPSCPGWNPVALGKPAQNRSPAVPLANGWRLFVGTDNGGVHAVDGRDGRVLWSRSAEFFNPLPSSGGVQAVPAGLFASFGGNNDMILVGTNNNLPNNSIYALDPATGNTLGAPYSAAAMGNVAGMAVVDYSGNRAFFLTSESAATLYGLDLGPVGTPSLSLAGLPMANPSGYSSGSSGAPVQRNDRLYFGSTGAQIFAVNLLTGVSYNTSTTDGTAKGFLWPDRRNNYLYFSSDGKVQGIEDLGGSFGTRWEVSVPTPSIVLQKPGTDYIYVGNGSGKLVQINVTNQNKTEVALEGATSFIGAPSLDRTHDLVIVGSSSGTIYAVRVPF